MLGFLFAFTLFVNVVFLAIIPVFGISYLGAEDSPIFVITVLFVNTFSILYIFWYEMNNYKTSNAPLWPYCIPFILAFLYLLDSAFISDEELKNGTKNFMFFYAESMSGIFIACFCYRFNKFYLIAKNLELLAILCTVGLIISLPTMWVDGWKSSLAGGGGHQTISYVAALNFGIFLIGYFTSNRYRYRLFQLSLYRNISVILALINAVVCIIGGGRGGGVLLIVFALLLFYLFAKKNLAKITFGILGVLIVFTILVSNITVFGINDMFSSGIERTFAFLNSSGIDMSNSSGRDHVYGTTIDLINKNFFVGYGFFYQYDVCQKTMDMPYCHNFFLETCLQGGFLYAIFWLYLVIRLIRRALKIISIGGEYYYILILFLYPFVYLMFSGTYLTTTSFWFATIFLLCFDDLKIKIEP